MYEKEKKELDKEIKKNKNIITACDRSITVKTIIMTIGIVAAVSLGIISAPLFEFMFLGPMLGVTFSGIIGGYLYEQIKIDKQDIANANLKIENANKDIENYNKDEQKKLKEHLNKIKEENQKNNYSYNKGNGEKFVVDKELERKLFESFNNLYDDSDTVDKSNNPRSRK